MVPRSQPHSKLKKRRRRLLAIRLSLGGALLLALFGGVVALMRAPFLRIATISISGAESLSTTTLQQFTKKELSGSYALLFPKNNVLLYPRRALAADVLAAFPSLNAVSVHANSFSGLSVRVAERQKAARWCGENPSSARTFCLWLDAQGAAFAEAPAEAASSTPWYAPYYGPLQGDATQLPAHFLPGQFASLSALVETLAPKVAQANAGALQDVGVGEDGTVTMYFSSGFELLFSLSQDPALVAEHLNIALGTAPFTEHPLSDFTYLDLRFGEKLYYKLVNSG